MLSQFEETSNHENYGWRFKTEENLTNIIKNGDFIKFQVIAQNTYSNAVKVFEKTFYSLGEIKEGIHVYGSKMEIK